VTVHDAMPWVNLIGWAGCLAFAWRDSRRFWSDVEGLDARLDTIESLMSARGLLPGEPCEARAGVERLTIVGNNDEGE
jgi:hypothetical protein